MCTSSTVVLSCVCVHFTDDRIPGSKGTLEKSTDGVTDSQVAPQVDRVENP